MLTYRRVEVDMHFHHQPNVPKIQTAKSKLACRTRPSADGISHCSRCNGPLYDGTKFDMNELVQAIRTTEKRLPSKVYRNNSGSIQTMLCPIGRIRAGAKEVVLGFLAILVGLAIPLVVNWLAAPAADC
jgi:hypothetical protein